MAPDMHVRGNLDSISAIAFAASSDRCCRTRASVISFSLNVKIRESKLFLAFHDVDGREFISCHDFFRNIARDWSLKSQEITFST